MPQRRRPPREGSSVSGEFGTKQRLTLPVLSKTHRKPIFWEAAGIFTSETGSQWTASSSREFVANVTSSFRHRQAV
jgi:hypothetical protein